MAKIMIVADNASMRTTITGVLTQTGSDIAAEASDGVEAVSNYSRAQPDLVTMDITMQNVNGAQDPKELLKQDPGANIAMVSAMGQESLVASAATVRIVAMDETTLPIASGV